MATPKKPKVTQLYGIDLPTKRRAVMVNQGQTMKVEIPILDETGNPVDLDDEGVLSVLGRFREVLSCRTKDIYTVTCAIDTPEDGLINFSIPSAVRNNPGVYGVEIAGFKTAGLSGSNFSLSNPSGIVLSNKLYVWVDRGLFGNPRYPHAGPPTIGEIRLYVRDNAPEENLLLDDFEFDLAEICSAAESAISYWNEAQPPVNVYFNTTNFAARDKWKQYITGHLLMMASHRFRRNHLPYQAAGIAVDDQNKHEPYAQVGLALMQDYKEWVKQKKAQINAQLAITSLGSDYSRNFWIDN